MIRKASDRTVTDLGGGSPVGFEGPNLQTAWPRGESTVGREEQGEGMLRALEVRSEAAEQKWGEEAQRKTLTVCKSRASGWRRTTRA